MDGSFVLSLGLEVWVVGEPGRAEGGDGLRVRALLVEGSDRLFTVSFIIRIMYVGVWVGEEVNFLQ